MLKGLGICPGLAMARVLVLKEQTHVISDALLPEQEIEKELARFSHALEQALAENDALYEKARAEMSEDVAAIFLAHREMLDDEYAVVAPIRAAIRENRFCAARAVDEVMDGIIACFESMDDEYMRARAADARDIRRLLIKQLLGGDQETVSLLHEDTIVAAREITPSDTAKMDLTHVVGFISEVGGATSHSAIIARSLEIPAVSQVKDLLELLHTGDVVLLDGTNGTVETDVTEETLEKYRSAKKAERSQRALCAAFTGKPTVTADGHKLELWANIGSPRDIERVLSSDAEGIGLMRSEFLYMDCDTLPDEETQYQAYKTVLEAMHGKPVVIRTLDIGGDKELPALGLEREDNPFLGYRAIRICLDRPELLRTQLRALLRAGVYGELRIMFPMISCLEELRSAKAILRDAQLELQQEGISHRGNVPVGMMIEVPAAAIMADTFAAEVDFFSIGTNDLTQYTLAADRGNAKVAHLYNTAHPAVCALIRHTIEAAHRHGIPCGVCGEAGADPALQPSLICWGVDELSMTPSRILPSRMEISKIRL